ncbi:MAG TPA: nitroreductase/quinone reductase family protein [Candidatus Binataceae bacterium]|nr:nitroreductase/quinone reductase family protein [Candidatus Binataceae bacterium]
MDSPSAQNFARPNRFERAFNALFGSLIGLGLGRSHHYLLLVRGRKTGRLYSAPIDLLTLDGRRYLVCPRGRSQWVRNAEAAGQVTLKRGARREPVNIRAVADADKPPLLKAYLERFKLAVQRYFPVPAGAPAAAFAAVAARYPVFEVVETGEA